MTKGMSLEELKKLNSKSEESQEEVENEEVEVDAEIEENETELEDDNEEESEEAESDSDDEEEAEEQEDSWLSSGKTVPLEEHIDVRQKLKSEKRSLEDENAELKKRLEAVNNAPPTQQKIEAPKVQDFENEYGEVDYDKFNQANAQYMQSLIDSKIGGQAQNDKVNEFNKQLKQVTDSHYEKAQKLVNDGVISAKDYAEADMNVLNAIQSVIPAGAVDALGNPYNPRVIADGMISNLSDVSSEPEKIWYKLGRDEKLMQEVIAAYGFSEGKGVAKLAQISQKYATPKTRRAAAPKPAPKIQGDSASATKSESKLKKEYDKARKSGDVAKSFSIKRGAKSAGVDVSKW